MGEPLKLNVTVRNWEGRKTIMLPESAVKPRTWFAV